MTCRFDIDHPECPTASYCAVMRVMSVRKMSEESSNVRVSDGKVGRTERVSDQSDVFMMSVMLMMSVMRGD